MTQDGRCAQTVLVEAPDGAWPRMCIDPNHPAGTDHRIRFRGVLHPVPDGHTRVSVNASPDVDQPVLV